MDLNDFTGVHYGTDIAFHVCMRKSIRSHYSIFLVTVATFVSGCGTSTAVPTTTTTATSATTTSSTSSGLAISPSSVSLTEGASYTFSASGGSGSGYTFAMGTGGSVAGTITTSGYYVAESGWAGSTYISVTDSAGNETFATITVSGTSSTDLTLTPSSVTLLENESYTFAASGGSGSGYVYSVPSSEGTINSSTGVYVAPSAWTGTTLVEVTDSAGNITFATLTITSSTTTSSTILSMTGTLTNCEGIIGGSSNTENWQVNGTELRTINDSNNYVESPVYCMGLSIAGSIPSTAVIQGVTVGIYLINQSSSTDGGLLQSLSLINGGSIIGTSKTLGLAIPGNKATFPTFTQGGSADLWSASLTPSVLSSTSFGIDIQTYRGSDRLFTGVTGAILPQVTVYYTN